MATVFIDGSAGTTGLRIRERLALRKDITPVVLPTELRKDPAARKDALNSADIAFLCLPDEAAKEAVAMVENPDTVLIDTSTAHRTDTAWTYGFPELAGQHEKIARAKRIANPGCHASGFVALTAPLTAAGLLPSDAALTCFSLTGYSGGGKKMIADYEAPENAAALAAPRLYALSQVHKHLPEMKAFGGLSRAPVFSPIVAPFYAGMAVTIPLFAEQLTGGIEAVKDAYRTYYRSGVVQLCETADENGFLSAGTFAGRDDMQIAVFGGEERLTVTARFDNLGKGASGAAIQNMNLVLGFSETEGLVL